MELTLINGKILSSLEERVREYCNVEIYDGYDNCHSVNNKISPKDIKAANFIGGRISKIEAEEIVNSANIQRILSLIDNAEIYTPFESGLKKNLLDLYYSFCSIKGVGIAKTTKILHLKRPKITPILDSFVINYLFNIGIQNISDKLYLAELGLDFTEKIWQNITNNREVLEKLSFKLKDLPILLTTVRIYDILIWTTEKWDERKIISAPYGKPVSTVIPNPDTQVTKQLYPNLSNNETNYQEKI